MQTIFIRSFIVNLNIPHSGFGFKTNLPECKVNFINIKYIYIYIYSHLSLKRNVDMKCGWSSGESST